ncbi:quinon protein alcohol dehydrogenase-like superfamily [Lentinula edodes]|nr:quinon protein alcohol dehydrogenase-like superfamily [Lentinula edodes]
MCKFKNMKNMFKKGKKSSPTSHTASPSPGTASEDIPAARAVPMEGSSVAQVQSVVLEILGPALELFKEASVALPPLQAVVGSVFKCFEIYQTISGNTEKLKALANDLTSRTKFLQGILDKEGLESSGEPLIQDLADDLERICKKVIVNQDVGLMQKLQMDKNSQKIEGFQKEIQDAYEECKMKLLFSIERNTAIILREFVLQSMRHSSEAFHDSDIVDRSPCHAETRKDILSEIEAWAIDASSEPGYWMFGMAGTGKSTIAVSVCEILKGRKVLAATFFCSRQIPECKNYRLIIPTLSYQLARFSRTFAMSVKEILIQEPDIVTKRPEVQIDKLLVEPWKAVIKAAQMESFYPVLVLDALDECQDIAKVLQPLVSAISKKELQGLKFFITSRPEPKIQAELKAWSASGMKEFILHNVEEDIVQKDISVYLQKELQEISPTEEQLCLLTDLSQQLFIYAATVVRFVKEADGMSRQRTRLLDCIENAAHMMDLKALYVKILDDAIPTKIEKEMKDDLNILYTIVSVGRPLTCKTIAELLQPEVEVETVSKLIKKLNAVFYQAAQDGPILIFHKSFYDFLSSYKDSKYKYNAVTQHESLTFSCCQIMEKLCFNICDLPSSFIKDDDVPGFKDKASKKIPETLNYCCQFWTDHFEIGQTDQLFQKVQEILIEKGIYWLEAMSLLKLLPRCSKMLDAILKTSSNKADHSSIERIVSYLQNLIRQFINGDVYGMTPHLYLSIMPFWKNGVGCKPQLRRGIKVINRVINWLPETTVTVNVSARVNSVQYSPMGDKIGTGCDDNTVRIWDARTGSQIGVPLQGHDDQVRSVAFSPDGTRIVSGSDDNTVRIWDASTGAQIGVPLQGHDHWVRSVAFSPDGTRIVSGSGDYTVRIWDASTGAQIGVPLQGYDSSVSSVAFSPDGTRIVSGSDDNTVRIWDASTGAQIGVLLHSYDSSVSSVAFSPDGTRIVSGSGDDTIRIWDASTGAQIGVPLQGHDDWVRSVAFSPDGTRIVSGSGDYTVRIWNASTGAQIGVPLQGHDSSVSSVAFSPDGTRIVSGSHDHTVRIWDASTGAQIGVPLQGHDDWVSSVAFSPDGTRIVSGSGDDTVRIWDASTGAQTGVPLQGHNDWVSSVAFSPDGTRIVYGSGDHTVRIWDASTGAQIGVPLQGHDSSIGVPLQGHDDWVSSVAFSPDGTRIVSGSGDHTVRIWDASTGAQIGVPLQGHDDWVSSVAFSPDGTRIVSGSHDHTVRIWDASTGAQIGVPLQGHDDWVSSVAFSPDGTRIVSGSHDHTVRIWDASTGAQIGVPLQGHDDWVSSVAFSPDGTRIVSGSGDDTVRIWDASTGAQIDLHWTISEDGWIFFPHILPPIVWIPIALRKVPWTAKTQCIISSKGFTKFSLNNCVYGEDWVKCIL